jgi:hypothetical protein
VVGGGPASLLGSWSIKKIKMPTAHNPRANASFHVFTVNTPIQSSGTYFGTEFGIILRRYKFDGLGIHTMSKSYNFQGQDLWHSV